MRIIHLTVTGEPAHPPCLNCRRHSCDGCDLRFQCYTKKPFVLGTVADEKDNHVVTLKWLLDNLEYHKNGYELVWKTSRSPQDKGTLQKYWGRKPFTTATSTA